MECSNTETVNA